jgi:hypothetical protein
MFMSRRTTDMRFHLLLHLVEGAYLELAHALAGDVVLSF